MKKAITTTLITRIQGQNKQSTQDHVVVEEPLEISLSIPAAQPKIYDKPVSITMRTPGHDKELAAGFLYTEGLLSHSDQIAEILLAENKVHIILQKDQKLDLSQLQRNFYTTSSCGVCGKASISALKTTLPEFKQPLILRVSGDIIRTLPTLLRSQQELFESTGGIHAAALFSLQGELITLREDVGRHNALDKLIGHYFLNDSLPLADKILLLSGRASFELIQKAGMAGVKLVLAVGAPSSLAVEMAEELGITLIGFLKEKSFNIYNGGERVIV